MNGCDYMKVDGFTARHMGLAVPLRKKVVYCIVGPDGFTERFNQRTTDLLCRMGLIELDKEDDPTTKDGYHYKTFKATGRQSMHV